MVARVIHADCRDAMREMAENSVDAIVTDPPYGLSREPDAAEVLRHWLAGDDYVHGSAGFMGREWDSFVPGPAVWREAIRMLKPGGFVVSFFGGRTYDLGVVAMRLAGFEVRDLKGWLHGQGFPKSNDVLKPALEPIVLARKPLSERTVAANVARWGTGALNIDGCRVATPDFTGRIRPTSGKLQAEGWGTRNRNTEGSPLGRHPPNVLHDGSQVVLALFPETGVNGRPNCKDKPYRKTGAVYGEYADDRYQGGYLDSGSAARFYPSFPTDDAPTRYCGKATKAERVSRCASCGWRTTGKVPATCPECGSAAWAGHPTVKPVALMRWLCRLVTPPGGTLLDPFAGTGTTLVAARAEGVGAIGIEQDAESVADIRHRLGLAALALEAAE